MIKKSKSDSAVSPVIGTILLVAITVVLIAIITAVVMGLADSEDGKKVGMNAQPASGNDAKLILYGGESLSDLIKLEMIDHDSPRGEYIEFWNISEPLQVGLPYLAENVARPLNNMDIYDTRINVKGTFTDGREVVLLVQPMTFGNVKGYFGDFDDHITIKWGSTDITGPGPYPVDLKSLPSKEFPSGVYMPTEKLSISVGANLPKEITKYKIKVESVTPGMKGKGSLESEARPISTTRPTSLVTSVGSVLNSVKGSLDGIWQITVFLCDDDENVILSKSWKLATTPKPTEVHTPFVGGTSITYIKESSVVMMFTYYSEEEPTSAKFYYKNLDTGAVLPPIDATVYGRGTASGSYMATLTGLESGARYEVRGEITLSAGPVECAAPYIYTHTLV